MKPKIYIHTGFDRDQAWPIQSWVIEGNEYETESRPKCSNCRHWLDPRQSLWLEGYDEYALHEDGIVGFYPNDYELIARRDEIKELVNCLTGIIPIPIRYSDWNQMEISPDEHLNHEPSLSAFEPIGICKGATNSDGVPLEVCSNCGALKEFYMESDFEEGNVLPIFSGWDESDIFKIWGANEYILTEKSITVLKSKGFGNITYQEINWAPTKAGT